VACFPHPVKVQFRGSTQSAPRREGAARSRRRRRQQSAALWLRPSVQPGPKTTRFRARARTRAAVAPQRKVQERGARLPRGERPKTGAQRGVRSASGMLVAGTPTQPRYRARDATRSDWCSLLGRVRTLSRAASYRSALGCVSAGSSEAQISHSQTRKSRTRVARARAWLHLSGPSRRNASAFGPVTAAQGACLGIMAAIAPSLTRRASRRDLGRGREG
jgi:hypothetical protein